jgi:hypothetical protein
MRLLSKPKRYVGGVRSLFFLHAIKSTFMFLGWLLEIGFALL